jgi:hypothetical protein
VHPFCSLKGQIRKTILLFVPLLLSLGCSKGLATNPAPTPSYVTISPQTATVACDVNGCTPQTVQFTATVKDQTGKNLMPNATVGFSIGFDPGSSHPSAALAQGPGQAATVTFQPALVNVYATAIITTFGGTQVKSQATITVTQQ